MLYNKFILFFITTVFVACQTSTYSTKTVQSSKTTDSCMVEGVHQYQLYIPSTEEKCKKIPLLLIIDPHADTSVLNRFIEVAEQFKVALVVSAVLKNNYPDFAHVINLLVEDVKAKYPVNQSLYLAGFSGGARMALAYAQYMPVDGIIACGALADPEELNAISCSVLAVAGMADFNFIEIAQYIFRPESLPSNLMVELSDDMHAWPPSIFLSRAFGYLFLSQPDNTIPCGSNKRWRAEYAANQMKIIDSNIVEGNLINAGLIAKALSGIEDLNESANCLIRYNELVNGEDYLTMLNQLKESIRFELAVRNVYNNALQSNDAEWWEREISSLETKMVEDKDYFRGLAYKRIKGFIGIMCYSLCRNSLQLNDLNNSERLLKIYQRIEPENMDMLYFYALYYNKINEPDEAYEYLVRAVKAGYTDKQRMSEDFPKNIYEKLIPFVTLN